MKVLFCNTKGGSKRNKQARWERLPRALSGFFLWAASSCSSLLFSYTEGFEFPFSYLWNANYLITQYISSIIGLIRNPFEVQFKGDGFREMPVGKCWPGQLEGANWERPLGFLTFLLEGSYIHQKSLTEQEPLYLFLFLYISVPTQILWAYQKGHLAQQVSLDKSPNFELSWTFTIMKLNLFFMFLKNVFFLFWRTFYFVLFL